MLIWCLRAEYTQVECVIADFRFKGVKRSFMRVRWIIWRQKRAREVKLECTRKRQRTYKGENGTRTQRNKQKQKTAPAAIATEHQIWAAPAA